MLRAYQSPCSGTHCAVQWFQMPNLASRNQSGVVQAVSDSHVGLNGPGAMWTCASSAAAGGLGEQTAGGEAGGEGRGGRGGKGGLQETATGEPGCGHAGNHRRREWAEARCELGDRVPGDAHERLKHAISLPMKRIRLRASSVCRFDRFNLCCIGQLCLFRGGFGGEFGEDFDAGGGADAGGPGVEHGTGVGEGADSAGGLDSGAGAGDRAHEGDVVDGGPAGGEASGGLDEVGPGGEGEFGGAELFLEGEQAGFEDDLDDGPVGVGEIDDGVDFVLDGVVVLLGCGLEQADVEHHVEVVRAELEDAGGLVALAGGERCAKREADDDADRDGGSGEGFDGAGDPCGVDHGAGEAMLGGLVAEADDLGAGGLGLEQGVVEDGGERGGGGESARGEGGGVEGRGDGDLEAWGGGG